ncbi:hypothetical protein [Kingella kingae]|uniref:hypothetical protein n=1 Tax=Kingella kingae TaxID=504 RepID=UPI001E52FD26|nr:hypothetical protein [Kingella kingae]
MDTGDVSRYMISVLSERAGCFLLAKLPKYYCTHLSVCAESTSPTISKCVLARGSNLFYLLARPCCRLCITAGLDDWGAVVFFNNHV